MQLAAYKITILLISILFIGAFLRFYEIDKIPPGLYIDEVSIGYNAYQILTSGHDEHGENMPLFFKAFGEYKLPVYIYLTSGSMKLFGKNEFAVRFPSALFGSLTILVMYFFIKELLKKIKTIPYQKIALLSTFLLAISPWHIHFSRGGFEASVGLFFYLLGCLLALIFWRNKKFLFLLLTYVSFALSIYTYATYKFITLVTVCIFVSLVILQLKKLRKQIIFATSIFLLVALPMLLFSFTANGNTRFNETSAFSEYQTKNFVDKMYIYPQVFIKDYISFFSLDFLFVSGDGNGRHQIPNMGLMFQWQLPFLLLGIFWLLRQKSAYYKFIIFGILLVAPLIPALTRPSPHTLRSLLMVIPLMILVSCGIVYFFAFLKKFRKVTLTVLVAIASYTFILYLHFYYVHYPVVNALDWGGAYKETITKVEARKNDYTHIIFDSNLQSVGTYVNFYSPNLHATYQPPEGDNFKKMEGKVLFISPNQKKEMDAKLIDEQYLPGPNKTVYSQFWEP